MKGFWNPPHTEWQVLIARLAAIMHYASDTHWQTIKDPFGAVISVRWPGPVPYGIHKREVEEMSEC